MSFNVKQRDHDEIYEYDPDEECVVIMEIVSTGPFSMIYRAHCSECDGEIEINDDPVSCANCDRDIVDVRGV